MTEKPEIHPTVAVARDLSEITMLHAELLEQAQADGDNPHMPGGTAMVALGHVANMEAWENRQQATERHERAVEGYRRAYTSVADEDPDDAWSAFQLLDFWSEQWRVEHDMEFEPSPHRPRPTIKTEADFIRWALDWAWRNEPHWTEFAADVRMARLRLENILSQGRRAERSRVSCTNPTCEDPETKHGPRLVKVYSPKYLTGWRCLTCALTTPARLRCEECARTYEPRAGHCTNMTGSRGARVECRGQLRPPADPPCCFNLHCPSFEPPEPVWASDQSRDSWKCPACKRRYDDEDFRLALRSMLWRPEAEQWVLGPDAISTLVSQGRGKRTIRRWLAPPVEEVDACTRCRKHWPRQEYAACPRKIVRHGIVVDTCGGELEQRWVGDGEAVIEGYCEVETRKTWYWWPTLWRRHLTTRETPRTRHEASA